MLKVIIDCQYAKAEYVELTTEEEAARLAEIAAALEQGMKDKIKRDKRQLITALAELREMKQNKDVFTDADIAEKQAEVDALRPEPVEGLKGSIQVVYSR